MTVEYRAKHSQSQIDELGKQGKAFKNPSLVGDKADGQADPPSMGTNAASVGSHRARLYGEFHDDARTVTEMRCIREMDPDERWAPRFEVREVPNGTGGTSVRFTGYASVVEKPYEVNDQFGPYMETIARGAFNKSLNDGVDVNFLCNHAGVTMARTKSGTLKLSSDDTGLHCEATLNTSRPDVQIVRAAVEDGDLDEMSFAFRATKQQWDEAYENRRINEVSLAQGDVSIVNFGANPATAGTVALRNRQRLAAGRPAARRSLILPDYTDEQRRRLASVRAKGGVRYDGAAEAALAKAKAKTPASSYSRTRWADTIDAARVRQLKWRAAGEPTSRWGPL